MDRMSTRKNRLSHDFEFEILNVGKTSSQSIDPRTRCPKELCPVFYLHSVDTDFIVTDIKLKE